MTRAIGIDLGTTYTLLATLQEGRPEIVPNAQGRLLTPSVVAFTPDGTPLVGQIARLQAAANPQGTLFSIKRQMGTAFEYKVGGHAYSAAEISSLVLRKVKADAEERLSERLDKAVITVPAYFNDCQRQATKEAGQMAGLEVIRIISEPTAAVLGHSFIGKPPRSVIVWDLGGGTFDVSILDLEDDVYEVRAVAGDTRLGGDDYDERLAAYLTEQYRVQVQREPPAVARQRIREAAEQAKIELSSSESASVNLPLFEPAGGSASHLRAIITRSQFEELTHDLLQRMVPPTVQAMRDAGLKARHIDRVVLVGGASRMPAVRRLARELLGQDPHHGPHPDHAVALGAAVQAGILLGQVGNALLLDVTPLSLGIETEGGLFCRIITRNTAVPANASRVFTTAANNQSSIDVHILQGEREMASGNTSLGWLHLDGIPPMPRGGPRIEVVFDIDVDGILHVSATDLLTDTTRDITLSAATRLSSEAVRSAIAEAEAYAAQDGLDRRSIEAGIQATSALAAAEIALAQAYSAEDPAWAEAIERAALIVKRSLAEGRGDDAPRLCAQLRDALAAGAPAQVPTG